MHTSKHTEPYRLPKHLHFKVTLDNGVQGTLSNFTAEDCPEQYSEIAREDMKGFWQRLGLPPSPIPELQIAFTALQKVPMRDPPLNPTIARYPLAVKRKFHAMGR